MIYWLGALAFSLVPAYLGRYFWSPTAEPSTDPAAQVLSILQLSYQALLSGTYVTKRNIFYQYPELFKEQRIVDGLVDDIAYTLGLGRDSMHIVCFLLRAL